MAIGSKPRVRALGQVAGGPWLLQTDGQILYLTNLVTGELRKLGLAAPPPPKKATHDVGTALH